jgi:hypothetical protein
LRVSPKAERREESQERDQGVLRCDRHNVGRET